ncbi:sensor histidine kinase [Flavobacterium sp.]|uniref:sensor histidine kinase n=1 Tax=Flavobacterium sp. TaxID=239 RepID=UPI003D6ADDC7
MPQLSFKNRIALNYMISTALLVAIVFIFIFSIVRWSVFSDVNADIRNEIKNHFKEMKLNEKKIVWINEEEWKEREHKEINIDPVFVQITGIDGVSIEKSPNLNGHSLNLNKEVSEIFYTTIFKDQIIRQAQVPIIIKGKTEAYLLIAMSLEDATSVLNNLSRVLYILYPIVLLILFIFARFIAGRSIKPVNSIIETSNLITRDNLKYRITLPQNKDELYQLSSNINSLLDRIESAVQREKQFTSDASHELRTPLAIIKGTLEVLIRKPRDKEEYKDKITFCISEVDRLNTLVDELLLLARFENQKQNIKQESVYLNALVLDTLTRYSRETNLLKINCKTSFEDDFYVTSDYDMITIIVSNLISNALKYCNENGSLSLCLSKENGNIIFQISNSGIGIQKEEIEKIFNPFFRSDATKISRIEGTGLGLSIVKRLCDLLKIEILIESEINQNTTVRLIFK